MSDREAYKSIAINFLLLIVSDAVLAFIIALIWNTAGVWLVPQLNSMSYLVAVGLSTFFILGDLVIKYWINRWIVIKNAKANAKALEKLAIADVLMSELDTMKKRLEEKGIL